MSRTIIKVPLKLLDKKRKLALTYKKVNYLKLEIKDFAVINIQKAKKIVVA
jgi:hypothetical protein